MIYDRDYFDRYVALRGTPIALRLNALRVALVEKYCTRGILDVGIGSGEFIERILWETDLPVAGYDINPHGISWLRGHGLWCDPWRGWPPWIDGVTLWDVLEHMPEPRAFLQIIPAGTFLFLSLPILPNRARLCKWKHHKPGEHLWHWTDRELFDFVCHEDFYFLESNDEETLAGREDIKTYVFLRVANRAEYNRVAEAALPGSR